MLIGAVAAAAPAQYGHPEGVVERRLGPDDDDRSRLLVVFDWDGAAITGAVNPGPNAAPVTRAPIDPSTWTLRFEAVGDDPAGNRVRYVVEGDLQNIGSCNRVPTGTWTQGAVTGDFILMRN